MAKELVVCDTDVLIDYWDLTSKRHDITKRALEEKIGVDNIVISAISTMELLMGARNKIEESKIKKNLLRYNSALINNEITQEALKLFEKYRLSHGLAIPDCFIAATALTMEIQLFSYNIKDYKFINNLKLYEKE